MTWENYNTTHAYSAGYQAGGYWGLNFYNATTAAYSNLLTVTNIGNVGIGTVTPAEQLDVFGNIRISNASNLGWIYGSDVNHSIIIRGDRNNTAANHTNYYQYGGTTAQALGHRFWTGGALAAQTEKLRISDDGISAYVNLSAPNLSGTNTGDQTNISGTAAYAANISGNTFILGGGSVSTSAAVGMYLNSADVNYWIGKRAGAWTQPLDIAFYTGIRYHAHKAYNGHIFYVDGYDTTEAFSVGKGDTNVRATNIVYASDFSASSDIRLKKDITSITDSLEKIKQINGIYYRWNETSTAEDKDTLQSGVIAQDVLKVFPEAVSNGSEYMSVSYNKLVPLLIEAIKDQQLQIDQLKQLVKEK